MGLLEIGLALIQGFHTQLFGWGINSTNAVPDPSVKKVGYLQVLFSRKKRPVSLQKPPIATEWILVYFVASGSMESVSVEQSGWQDCVCRVAHRSKSLLCQEASY